MDVTSAAPRLFLRPGHTLKLKLPIIDDFSFKTISYGEYQGFFRDHPHEWLSLEERHTPFWAYQDSPAKEHFLRDQCHLFGFFKHHPQGTQLIGVLVGNPLDWSSYYLRFVTILPPYRGQRLLAQALSPLLAVLTDEGFERVECEVSPSNTGQIKRLSSLGFYPAGQKLSERWGALVVMSKYLSPKHHQTFLEQFCLGPRPANS